LSDKDALALQLQAVQAALKETEATLNSSRVAQEKLESSSQTVQSHLDAERAANAELKSQVNALSARLADQTKTLGTLGSEALAAAQVRKQLEDENELLEQAKRRFTSALRSLNDNRDSDQQQQRDSFDRSQQDLGSLRAQTISLEAKLASDGAIFEAEKSSLTKQIEEARQQIAQLEQQLRTQALECPKCAIHEAHSITTQSTIAQLHAELRTSSTMASQQQLELESQLQVNQRKLQESQLLLQSAQSSVKLAEEQLANLANRSNSKNADLSSQLADAQSRIVTLEARVHDLEKALAEATNRQSDLSTQLQQDRKLWQSKVSEMELNLTSTKEELEHQVQIEIETTDELIRLRSVQDQLQWQLSEAERRLQMEREFIQDRLRPYENSQELDEALKRLQADQEGDGLKSVREELCEWINGSSQQLLLIACTTCLRSIS
jgi:chromosome segregation ATPase